MASDLIYWNISRGIFYGNGDQEFCHGSWLYGGSASGIVVSYIVSRDSPPYGSPLDFLV